jgi:hypothetical protein
VTPPLNPPPSRGPVVSTVQACTPFAADPEFGVGLHEGLEAFVAAGHDAGWLVPLTGSGA